MGRSIRAVGVVVAPPPVLPDDPAEGAFEVVDDYQGRGIGSVLARELATDARAAGITTLVATVCGDNPRAVSLLTRIAESLHVRWRGGEREIVLGLGS